MYEMYELWKKTETNTIGCPEDESESTTTKTYFYLINVRNSESFGEFMADDYGNQDYSWQVSYKKLMTIDSDDLKELNKIISKEIIDLSKRTEDE